MGWAGDIVGEATLACELVVPPGDRPAAIARGAVAGRHDRRWEATHTLSVVSYTGHAWFKDVVGNAACTLAGLDAINVRSRVLAVPPIPYVVAVRADGVLTFVGRPLWLQQSNYLARLRSAAHRTADHSQRVRRRRRATPLGT